MEPIDTQLEQALSFANYQTTLNQQRKLLKEQFETDTVVAYEGGLFKITQEWLGGFDIDAVWFLDANGTPILIKDTRAFYATAKTAYNQAMTQYGEAYQKLRTQRSVRSLTDL